MDAQNALKIKGFDVTVETDTKQFISELKSGGYSVAWIISGMAGSVQAHSWKPTDTKVCFGELSNPKLTLLEGSN